MQKIQLLRGVAHGRIAFTGPFFIEIDVTSRCNMNCLGCQYHSSQSRGFSAGDSDIGYIDPDLVNRLGDQISRLGTKEIIITGEGEPLLHPRLFEMIAALKKAGFKIQLFTNGTLLDHPAAAAILETGVDILKVSLWASTPEEYERCYPGAHPEYFTKTISGIETVARLRATMPTARTRVLITAPINRFNYKGIDTKIDLALRLGCDGIALNPYKHWSGEFREAAPAPDEITGLVHCLPSYKKRLAAAGLIHNIDDLLLQYQLGETSWNSMPCFTGWYSARIRADGEVLPCCRCYLPLGNLNSSDFQEIWNGPAYRDFRAAAVRRSGLALLQGACACQWCMLTVNNYRVNRLARILVPWIERRWDRND